jgi:hypothetical protein
MPEVLEVEFDPALHVLQIVTAPGTIDLCPAGNPRPNLVTQHVSGDDLAVIFVHCHDVRTRPDKTHGTGENVEQLWQLIERGLANEGAERGDPLIAALHGVKARGAILGHAHGSKLVNHEFSTVETVAPLPEQDRTR